MGKLAAALLLAVASLLTAARVSAAPPEFPPGRSVVELPTRFVDGDIIVRLAIGGRALDFVLDSGSSSVVIDAGAARGLALAGETGSDGAARVAIPELTVGALTLRDVAATTLTLRYRAKDRTPIAGFLGYDFLAGAVVHVDYAHRRAFAIAPQAFDASALGVAALPLALEDGVPMIRAKVGDSFGSRFIVDSGADDVYLFDSFARAHPADVTDRAGAAKAFSSLAYLGDDGAPARMGVVAIDIRDFVVGGIDFRDFLAYRIAPDPSTPTGDADLDADGLIGYRFLRYYDVYFDYPAARLFLVPNAAARNGS